MDLNSPTSRKEDIQSGHGDIFLSVFSQIVIFDIFHLSDIKLQQHYHNPRHWESEILLI